MLVRYIKSVCPAQAIDDYTYETWHDIIGHLDPEAARAAVIAVKHSQTFVDPSDIIREVERAQHRRAHPSERTVAEAIADSTQRELAGPHTPPNAEYLRVKQELLDKQAARDAAAMGNGPQHPPVAAMDRHAAYGVKCPWCGAQPGSRCVNTVEDTPKTEPHPARVEAGRRAAA